MFTQTACFAFCAAIVILGCNAIPRRERTECPELCPYSFSPVCGTDGEKFTTFINKCQMDYTACTESKDIYWVKEGECDQPEVRSDVKDCVDCIKVFEPVCASDGTESRTFANECEMEFYNCWESKNFDLLRSGTCEE